MPMALGYKLSTALCNITNKRIAKKKNKLGVIFQNHLLHKGRRIIL